jgi:SAM-dependent methyltransferase
VSKITDKAAELNRGAWNSFRRQRDEGLSQHRRDSAEDILAGKGHLRREYIELAGDVSGKRLLDMGCGEAAETCEWARLGAHVVGADNSPKQIEAGRRNAEKLGVSCHLVVADLLRLPDELLRGEFDIVFSCYVTAWIGDKDKWFRDVYRALKPGGVFLLGGGHPVTGFVQWTVEDDFTGGSYLSEGPFTFESNTVHDFNPAGEFITSIEWAHTLGTMITTLARNGFHITHLVEMSPAQDGPAKGLPEDFIIRAVKE